MIKKSRRSKRTAVFALGCTSLSSPSPISGLFGIPPFHPSFPVRWRAGGKIHNNPVFLPSAIQARHTVALCTQYNRPKKGSNETGELPFSPSLFLSVCVCGGVFSALPICVAMNNKPEQSAKADVCYCCCSSSPHLSACVIEF